jgi:DNA-binding PadR family transcriptional regulator
MLSEQPGSQTKETLMTSMNPEDGPRRFRNRRFGRHTFSGPADGPMAPPPPFGPVDEDEIGPPHGRGHGPGRRGRRPGPPFPPVPPFGPGFGPGGRGRFPGPRGRRGRRTARGDIRLAVLALVSEQPRHGYEIIQEIADRSGGEWRPSPGSVYPTLSQLQDEGLVRVENADGRRVVHLTGTGTTFVEEHRAELDAVWESVGRDGDDDGGTALWEQLAQLHAATQQVLGAGTPEQITAASAALAEARKTIYRLLAE